MVHMVMKDSEEAQDLKGANNKVSGLGTEVVGPTASITGFGIRSSSFFFVFQNRMTVLRTLLVLVNLNKIFPVRTYTMNKQL